MPTRYDHRIYDNDGHAHDFVIPDSHLAPWGVEDETALFLDPTLDLDPDEYAAIDEAEAGEADEFFGSLT